MKNNIIIGIDLDGVIFNFSRAFSEYCNFKFGNRCPIIYNNSDVIGWNWIEWYPISIEEEKIVWNDIKQSKNFWQSLKLINTYEFDALRKAFNNYNTNVITYFITSRIPTEGNNLHLQCINSLTQYQWKNPQIILTNKKEDIVKDLGIKYFIDDKGENCILTKEKNPECNVYIMGTNYNTFIIDTNIKRISSLYSFILDIKNNKNYIYENNSIYRK